MLLFAAAALAESVTMRDGVSLATDVSVPVGAGPWPTILRRTPYGRTWDAATITALNDLGYAVVSQDVRGRGGSDGVFAPFFDDALDGADTVAWVREQSWSDGHMAMFGGSAESIVQLLADGEGPDGLDAIQPYQGSADMRASLYPGGAWRQDLTTDWLASLEEEQAEAALRENEVDGPFWDPVRLDAEEWARADGAMFLVAGFFDIFEGDMPKILTEAQAAGNTDTWLILGPWTHGGSMNEAQGDVDFADGVYAEYYTELFVFYDYVLQGGPRPEWAPVRYGVTTFADNRARATTEWVDAETWPPPNTPERLYLGDVLGPESGGGPVVLDVDPTDPVPSVGGGNLNSASGVYDQTDVDARDDVFVLATPVRYDTVTIAGDLSATIWAASATTDVDVIARIEVVPPNEKVWLIADGIRRGRFVWGEDAIRPLTPGEPVPFELDLGPVAVTLPPGHTLRVAISGTLSPRYEVNPNEALPIADRPTPVPTTLTIYRDDAHPSSLVVPMTAGTLGGVEVVDDPVEEPVDISGVDISACGCGGGSTAWLLLPVVYGARRRRVCGC
jgi:predicted acyl esterase